jgi:hypothetical protein
VETFSFQPFLGLAFHRLLLKSIGGDWEPDDDGRLHHLFGLEGLPECEVSVQGHILYPQYLEWRQGQGRSSPQPTDVPPLPDLLLELTPEQRLAKYQAMWQAPVCRKGIKEAIAAHPEWGLTIDKDGPEVVKHGAN